MRRSRAVHDIARVLDPPSALTGMSPADFTIEMAVSWGTPTPVTMRVVQMEPGPTPTFTASTPRSTSALAPSRVAMFPATNCTFGEISRRLKSPREHLRNGRARCRRSVRPTPASTSAAGAVSVIRLAPIAARQEAVRVMHWAFGKSRRLWMSLTNQTRRVTFSSTTGSSRSDAPRTPRLVRVVQSALTRFFDVIASRSGRSDYARKWRCDS